MRLDKYLKVARVFKRRTIAKEVSKNDLVYVNDRIAKPSTILKEGDIVKVTYGTKEFTIRVTQFLNQASKEQAQNMYEVIEEKTLQTENRNN